MKVNGTQKETVVTFAAVKMGTVFRAPNGDVLLKMQPIQDIKSTIHNAVDLETGTVWTFFGDVIVKVFPSARVELYGEE